MARLQAATNKGHLLCAVEAAAAASAQVIALRGSRRTDAEGIKNHTAAPAAHKGKSEGAPGRDENKTFCKLLVALNTHNNGQFELLDLPGGPISGTLLSLIS